MTDDEKFLYFVDYFSKGSNPVLDKKDAYDRAGKLVHNYCKLDLETKEYTVNDEYKENTEIVAAIESYVKFDIDALVIAAKRTNLDTYVSLVESLSTIERSYGTVLTRKQKIEEINTFIKRNLSLMEMEGDFYTPGLTDEPTGNGAPDYDEYEIIFNRIVKQVDYDESSEVFIGYMQRFKKATSLAATERYIRFAKNLIDNDLLDLNLILIETTPYRENFTELIEAYDIYVNSHIKVEEVNKSNNSKKIVQCMNAISNYRDEALWEANRDLMLEYLNIVKESILGRDAEGNLLYDPNYDGVDEAVRFFNRAYGYFYAQAQEEHVAYLSYILELIAATDEYVEKIGLVALADKYVDTNEVDYTDTRIVALLNNIETSRSELEFRGEDYAKLLQQNAVYFVNYVAKMRTARTYAEQVEYYEAAALLYFSLDSTVEGAREAVEIFDEYEAKLTRIRESSVKFLEAMSIYRACQTADEKYAALVDCYYNAQFAELSYEGVEAAMAEYKAAYDAYVSYANAANNDITVTGHAVGSFRVNSGITTIVAIIVKKIFGV